MKNSSKPVKRKYNNNNRWVVISIESCKPAQFVATLFIGGRLKHFLKEKDYFSLLSYLITENDLFTFDNLPLVLMDT